MSIKCVTLYEFLNPKSIPDWGAAACLKVVSTKFDDLKAQPFLTIARLLMLIRAALRGRITIKPAPYWPHPHAHVNNTQH